MEDNFYDKSYDITELTFNDLICSDENIKLKKIPNLNGLIILYAPWCLKCYSMINFWEDISNLYKYKIKLMAYNTYNHKTKNEKIGKYIKLNKYPKYFMFNKNDTQLREITLENNNDIEKWISINSF